MFFPPKNAESLEDDPLSLLDVPKNETALQFRMKNAVLDKLLALWIKILVDRIKYMKRIKNDSNLHWIQPVQDDVHKTKKEHILIIQPITDISSRRTIIF